MYYHGKWDEPDQNKADFYGIDYRRKKCFCLFWF